MTIIKTLNIAGSVEAYLPEVKVGPTKIEKPIEVSPKLQIEALLGKLSTSESKFLLAKVFDSELIELKQKAISEGFDEGKVQAELNSQKLIKPQLDNLLKEIQSWSDSLLSMEKINSWIIDDEEAFCSLLFQATCQLLQRELKDDDYAKELVTKLTNEYATKSKKHLVLSKLHYQQLETLNQLELLGDHFEISADPLLLPGSFKLNLANGSLTYDLEVSLQQLKSGLLDISRSDK